MIPVLNKRADTIPDGAVYIGRPSPWGNPYQIGRNGNRNTVIHLYREWIVKRPELVDELAELEPTALVCWCAPLGCHGDVLAELIGDA